MSLIRVFVDLREVLFQGRGWERYGVSLLRELLGEEELHFLFLVENQEKARQHYPFLCSPRSEFAEQILDRQPRFAPQQFPPLAECDIYHCLTEYPEFYPEKTKLIVAIHDLSAFKNPTLFSETFLKNAQQSYSFVLEHADRLVVFSQTVANDLLFLAPQLNSSLRTEAPEHLPLVLIPHGLDHLSLATAVSGALPWPEPFFLVVGGFEVDKNLNIVVEAFGREPSLHKHYQLVFLGPKAASSLLALPHCPNIHRHSGVSDELLATAYRRASALICPSLDEGFGFTPREALSLGCPAIVSDIPVFRENMEESALFFDPHSASSLARTWLSFIENPKTPSKPAVTPPTWKEAAKKMKAVYHSLLSPA